MKQTVYIETTVISYLTARSTRDPLLNGWIAATRQWWDSVRPAFDLYASQLVYDEASVGDAQAAVERLGVLANLPNLRISDDAESVAIALLKAMALPSNARRDALHVGIAAVHGIDYLLTWNCRHLANATLRGRIEAVCRTQGFEPPTICTPIELMEIQP